MNIFLTNNQPTVTAHIFQQTTLIISTKPSNNSKNSNKKSKPSKRR